MAGDQRGCWRSKKYDRAGYIHGLADPVQRSDTLDDVGASGRIGKEFVRAGGRYERRGYRIHRNVVFTPLNRQAFGQMRNRRFSHAVNRFTRKRHISRL